MPHHAPSLTRRGSALRTTSMGCAVVLLLVIAVLVLTFGYFGPGLAKQDYDLLYVQHAETQSGLDANQAERSRQVMHEIQTILTEHATPLLVTDAFKLGGDEVSDPDLPADQVAAIEAVGDAMETSGFNSRVDELISLGAALGSSNSTMRSLARILGGQLTLAWRAGDAEAAALAYTRLRGLASAQANASPSLLGRLVAIAIDAMATSMVRQLLTERTADAELIRAVYDAHVRAPDRKDWLDLEAVLHGERIIARAALVNEGLNVPIRAINPGAADQDRKSVV